MPAKRLNRAIKYRAYPTDEQAGDKDHDLLMSIRAGKYMLPDGTYAPEFFDMVTEYDKRLQYAGKHTDLPDHPERNQVEELAIEINRLNLSRMG